MDAKVFRPGNAFRLWTFFFWRRGLRAVLAFEKAAERDDGAG